MNAKVLEVHNLRTQLFTPRGVLTVVDEISFAIGRGRILGLVGEEQTADVGDGVNH